MIPKHGLNSKYEKLVRELHHILSEHKKSPIEFARKDKFIICSPSYQTKTVDPKLGQKVHI
jgi:hypothetical protein